MNNEKNLKECLIKIIEKSFLILDGATGTELQKKNIDNSKWIYKGKNIQGCNEALNFTAEEIIESVHMSYLEAGANIIKTNSFGCIVPVLKEYSLENECYDLAKKSASIAKNAIKKFTGSGCENKDRKYFVAGSLGPGSKLPSLGQITFDELYESYRESVKGLIEGGADIILFETAQDILQLKAGILAAYDTDKNIPIMASVTIEKEGAMLMGTDIETAATVLSNMPIFSFGMNCGTGADIAINHLRKLSEIANLPISIHTNAGLPENKNGKAYYAMTADEFALINYECSKLYGVSFIGGCCGTSPMHIKALSEKLKGSIPLKPKNKMPQKSIASLYLSRSLKQNHPPFFVGERSNMSGSKIFREFVFNNDLDSVLDIAIKQVKSGSYAIDVNTAWVGRDEKKDMTDVVSLYAKKITEPLMIDSIKPEVIEAALKIFGGKAIINSANFEQGEEKFDKICSLAKRYGAALICLTIDENGMAKTAFDKIKIARRMFLRATKEHGIYPHDIIFDLLTFTVASAEEGSFHLAEETLLAIKEVSKEFKECSLSLGISNISFGLKEMSRIILNSVFLSEAVKHGLTMAIVNTAQIIPLNKIDKKEIDLALKVIYNKEKNKDALIEYINYFENKKAKTSENILETSKLTLEEEIKSALIDGKWKEMQTLLNKAKTYEKFGGVNKFADFVLNNILLKTMTEIGELFAEGAMQLPFVLGSAEVMKKSVDYLSCYMDKKKSEKTKTIILGTVAGDVHDVGKNLVDIILSNNGYKVINIGTKVSIEEFIKNYREFNADAIGMSGLLVKSTEVMKENLKILKNENINTKVLLGGAALTKEFVEKNCRDVYGEYVYYCKDAFDAIEVLKQI